MKQKLFIFVSLPLVLLATACGHSNDQPATTVAAAGVTCTPPTVNVNNQCVNPQGNYYGQPPTGMPGYNGQGYTTPPPGYNSFCSGQYWNSGYSYTTGCFPMYGYRYWYYYGGYFWYW